MSKKYVPLVNTKIIVFVAVIALAAALVVILTSGTSIVSTSEQNIPKDTTQVEQKIQPITVELNDISIIEVTERNARIEISFKLSNPNPKSVIVQVMDYQLYETGYSNEEQLSGGEIGSRPEGMVEFGSNYYTLLSENTMILKDNIVLKNTGNTQELWSALENNNAKWRVTGNIFFNLSSMTSGQENELHFEFVK
jgi:LEA14-like dessication related protein